MKLIECMEIAADAKEYQTLALAFCDLLAWARFVKWNSNTEFEFAKLSFHTSVKSTGTGLSAEKILKTQVVYNAHSKCPYRDDIEDPCNTWNDNTLYCQHQKYIQVVSGYDYINQMDYKTILTEIESILTHLKKYNNTHDRVLGSLTRILTGSRSNINIVRYISGRSRILANEQVLGPFINTPLRDKIINYDKIKASGVGYKSIKIWCDPEDEVEVREYLNQMDFFKKHPKSYELTTQPSPSGKRY